MEEATKGALHKVADTIRQLAMDAVQKANSGHPGLPMGCAELGAYLYGHALHHNPKNSHWVNRDRFVLSAGHGCMLLYACCHLAGYNLSLEEIKNFRQLHSQTPGHPEYGHTDGIEVTTGPLGQGVGNAVGLALGFKILKELFNTPTHSLFDNKIYCLAGDGCIMEGVSAEVSSLAGHLGLDNLILLYDYNKICLDGPISECLSEDTKKRYEAYGWEVYDLDGYDFEAMDTILKIVAIEVIHLDGYDFEAMDTILTDIRKHQKKPALILCHTVIGKGSPHKADSHKAHGSPLGEEEVKLTKEALGLPEEPFFIPQAVKNFFSEKLKKDGEREERWNHLFQEWSKTNPDKRKMFDAMREKHLPADLEETLKKLEITSPIGGRNAAQSCLALLGEKLPQLVGGSADLSGSDMTMMKAFPIITPHNFKGRNIKYGVREFGMATMAAGLSRTGMITPFIGTFCTFSDYMRNAIRLAALSRIQVIYQFTHDSIFLGEDGPTHQSVEHYMALRAIPHLHVIRPGDVNEVKMAWLAALKYKGPTALILSRQKLPELAGTNIPYDQGVGKGAYILRKEVKKPDYTLIATGSELHLAFDVADELTRLGKGVRVVSMPCWELFEHQKADYKKEVLGGDIGKRVSIESGIDQGWYKYIGLDGIAIAQDDFGASAPADALAKEFGFTVEAILERILD